MRMMKFCLIALTMTTLMTKGTARYIPANNYALLEKLINRYDPSVVNYDYGEDDTDNQVDFYREIRRAIERKLTGNLMRVRFFLVPFLALKKDALLLEKLMLTLQKNAEDDSNVIELPDRKDLVLNDPRLQKFMIRRNRSENRKTGMELQRRGRINGSVYWKCYFNAVTCF